MATTNSLLPPRDFGAADPLTAPPDPLAMRDLACALPANGNDADAAAFEESPVSGTRLSTRGNDTVDGVTEDAALVHAACARDPRAQTRIWRKYAPLVRARLRGSVGVRDLDDLVQEVFLRLFECLPALRQPSALRSFIIGISIRVGGTELRRRGSRWWLCLMPTDSACDELSATYRFDEEGHEAFARFEAILAELAPHARRIFELRYVENKGLATVAETMGVSLATAKRQLARVHAQVLAMVAHDEVLRGYAYKEQDTANQTPATVDARAHETVRARADAADATAEPDDVDPSAAAQGGEQAGVADVVDLSILRAARIDQTVQSERPLRHQSFMRCHAPRFLVLLASVLVALGGAGCAKSGPPPDESADDAGSDGPGSADLQGLVSLSITPKSASLTLVYGSPIAPATQQLTAMGTFEDGSTKDVTRSVLWTIDSPLATIGTGLFSAQAAGQFQVAAGVSPASATATIIVKLTGEWVDPSAQGAKAGLDQMPGGSPPTIAYPIDGALFPAKLAPLEFQMVPNGSNGNAQTAGRVAIVGDLIDVRAYLPCAPIAQPSIPGACALTLPPEFESQLAGASEAEHLSERVRLSMADGSALVESAPIDVRWSSDTLQGGLYFWSAQPVGQGGKNELMRYDLDQPLASPEVYYTDDDTKKLEPQTQSSPPCFGCHSISLDGTKIGLTFGGSVPSLFALLDVATKKPLTAGTEKSLRISDGDAPGFQASKGYATQTVFSREGNVIIQAFRGQLVQRAADATLADQGAPLFMSTLDPLGEKATQPFWSASGDLFAFASWVPLPGDQLTGDIVTGAQLWTVPVGADGSFAAPTVLVPRVAGRTEYNPAISDDSQWIAFNESRCDGPPTPQSSNWGLGACDSYDDPSARVKLVSAKGGSPVDLARANGAQSWTSSVPRFSPSHGTHRGKSLYWIAFSSRRPYGAKLPGWDGGASAVTEPQLWFAAVAVDAAGALAGDPSFAPVWMPQQNEVDGTPRGNHVPQWVKKAVQIK